MRTYLLVGNYGVGNVGDEALREYFLARFPEVEWIVVSAHPVRGSSFAPSELRRTQYLGIRAAPLGLALISNSTVEVPRLPLGLRSFFGPWWRTLYAYWQCDGVVFGGGSLFTDTESVMAPFLWWWHAVIARMFQKPIFLAFQGIGPFHTRVGEWCARWVGRRAIFFSVRDVLSFDRVEPWKLNKKCILSFDPVLSLVLSKNIRINSMSKSIPDDADRSKILLIIPRGNSSQAFRDRSEKMRCEGWEAVRVQEPHDLSELCRAVSSASFLLTQRYHAGIVALALRVPFAMVPQVPGDKLDALNHEDRDRERLEDRVRVGEEALRVALQASSPRGRGSR